MTATLSILEKLVSFDTTSSKSNLGLVGYVEEFLKLRGFTVHRITDATGDKAGLFAETGASGDGVLLSAHTDVVPVAGQHWTVNPFQLTRERDRAYGRGTTDMKGFIASTLALADRASQKKLREPLKIVLSYDEEVGCVGIQRMMESLAPMLGQPRACIVGEPTEMQVAIGHKGKAALRAACFGQSGHSALAPNFVNAIELATDFVTELRNLQQELAHNSAGDAAYSVPYTTIHVGKLSGGRALNIVADRADVTFEYRHIAADKSGDLFRRIIEAAERAGASHRHIWPEARIEVEQYLSYPGLDVSETDEIVTYGRKLAQNEKTTKVAFGTEAGFFSELGIPTVVCGPGSMERQGHVQDEYVELDQLAACDAMMDRLLKDIAD